MSVRVFLAFFVQILSELLLITIFVRVIFSWIRPRGSHGKIYQFIFDVTEPILGVFRKYLPKMGMIDISPIVAYIAILFISNIIISILGV